MTMLRLFQKRSWVLVVLVGLGLMACGKKNKPAEPTKPAKPAEQKADPKKEPPKAPSTGKEMPQAQAKRMSMEEAAQLVEKVVAAIDQAFAKKEAPPCAKAVPALKQGLWGAEKSFPVAKETAKAYTYLAYCAAQTNHWTTVVQVVGDILKVKPDFPYAVLLPQALLALNEYERAGKVLVSLNKAYPGNPEIVKTAAQLECKLQHWKNCAEYAQGSLVLLQKASALPPEQRPQLVDSGVEINIEARQLLAQAQYQGGVLEASTTTLASLGKDLEAYIGQQKAANNNTETLEYRLAEIAQQFKRNQVVGISRVGVSVASDPEMYLGIYHLQQNPTLVQKGAVQPLVRLQLKNFDKEIRQIRYEVQVAGVTGVLSGTEDLVGGESKTLTLSPTLDPAFKVNGVEAEMPGQLRVKVTADAGTATKALQYEKNFPIKVLPREFLPLAQRLDADTMIPRPEFVAAWMTSNAKEIEEFLGTAKQRVKYGALPGAPSGNNAANGMFAGLQAPTFSQVRALYDALKAKGLSYVMDPTVLSEFGYAQRTRLPADVLRSTNAQCLEGTLLFATLLRAVGLEPILVRVPGHAFVGWKVTEADKQDPTFKDVIDPNNGVAYLETTMIGNATFEEAVRTATARVIFERKQKSFDAGIYGRAFMLNLEKLYNAGFTPQALQRG